ncbi:MAG TPA: alpha/beta fold hydrolase [Candidatus Limiplasma sp.]|nr:alpha/beta fold hydrolase [Candidatus Limiplasma sp.]
MKTYEENPFDADCCQPFLFPGGPKGILLLHGFTGSVSHMRPLADLLAGMGYTVQGINLPGHATTEAGMARSGWKQWLDASRSVLIELRKHCPVVTVAGLSMGGVISLLLAEEGLPDACVTLSAPMATQNKWIGLSRIVAPIKPRISWAPPEERKTLPYAAYDFGYSGFPTAKAADLNRLIHMARKNLSHVTCPVLAVQSRKDGTISPDSAEVILQGVSSVIKQKLMLADAPHVCTLSSELPDISNAMDLLMSSL